MRPTYLWVWQLVTGALLAFFLGTHMVMMHLEIILSFFGIKIPEPTAWDSMMERARESFWLAFYILFLAFVLYHGLYGLRGIILELSPSARAERLITWVIITIGIIVFALGTYVSIALFRG